MTGQASILIGRVPPLNPHAYDVVTEWIQKNFPEIAYCFHLCTLPFFLRESAPYRVLIQWLQDPLDAVDHVAFLQALDLQAQADERGIKIVNAVQRHKNTAKTEAYRRLSKAGIQTPKVWAFDNFAEFLAMVPRLPLPVVVREDIGHAGQFFLVGNPEEARAVPWLTMYRPVVSQYMDVESDDGRFRKYRCFAIGDKVITNHLQTGENWLVRGKNRIRDAQTREEEIAYISQPDPFEEIMLRVSGALELEYLGIDYSIDSEGRPVIWEANQYPHLHFSKIDLIYRNFAMERTIAAMVRYYLQEAGVTVPSKLEQLASYL